VDDWILGLGRHRMILCRRGGCVRFTCCFVYCFFFFFLRGVASFSHPSSHLPTIQRRASTRCIVLADFSEQLALLTLPFVVPPVSSAHQLLASKSVFCQLAFVTPLTPIHSPNCIPLLPVNQPQRSSRMSPLFLRGMSVQDLEDL